MGRDCSDSGGPECRTGTACTSTFEGAQLLAKLIEAGTELLFALAELPQTLSDSNRVIFIQSDRQCFHAQIPWLDRVSHTQRIFFAIVSDGTCHCTEWIVVHLEVCRIAHLLGLTDNNVDLNCLWRWRIRFHVGFNGLRVVHYPCIKVVTWFFCILRVAGRSVSPKRSGHGESSTNAPPRGIYVAIFNLKLDCPYGLSSLPNYV